MAQGWLRSRGSQGRGSGRPCTRRPRRHRIHQPGRDRRHAAAPAAVRHRARGATQGARSPDQLVRPYQRDWTAGNGLPRGALWLATDDDRRHGPLRRHERADRDGSQRAVAAHLALHRGIRRRRNDRGRADLHRPGHAAGPTGVRQRGRLRRPVSWHGRRARGRQHRGRNRRPARTVRPGCHHQRDCPRRHAVPAVSGGERIAG